MRQNELVDEVLMMRATIASLKEERDRLVKENERLHDRTGMAVTVGGGLSVYGTVEAIMRVQDFILIDSTHPVEKEDVRRSLARSLAAAEASNAALRVALRTAETVMMMVEPRSHKAEYLEALDAVRSALDTGKEKAG